MLRRRARWRRQGRLGEQHAPDEQVEQAPDGNRGDQRREPGGEPTHRPGQPAQRPEHQHDQDVADQRLGRQRQDGEDRRDRIGPRLPEAASARSSVTGEPSSSMTPVPAGRGRSRPPGPSLAANARPARWRIRPGAPSLNVLRTATEVPLPSVFYH
jgi:hypothetical protein